MSREGAHAYRKPTPDEIASTKLIPYCVARYPKYEISLHNQVIAEYLEAIERNEITRLILELPPRHGKTLMLQMFAEWYIGRHPDEDIIYSTYSGDRAQDVGLAVKTGMASDEFKYVFPGIHELKTSTAKSKISLKTGGNLYFYGVGEGISGKGANILIVDDPLRGEIDAMSNAVIKTLRIWYSSSAYARQAPKFAIIICHTRWTTNDLIGWVKKEHDFENWTELRLPAIAENDDIIGRKPGEALWPNRYPERVLNHIKKAMKSSRRWNAIYQQRPVPEEGALINKNWFSRKYYRYDNTFVYFRTSDGGFIQERIIRIVQSWDTAYKAAEINDPSACTTWAVTRVGYALIHGFKDKLEYPSLKKKIFEMHDEYNPSAVLVEDRSSGQSLIQEFKDTPVPVIGVQVSKDKTIRMKDETDVIEAGKVFLPEFTPPWLDEFLDEVTVFPYGSEDDYTDTFSMFLHWIKGKAKKGKRKPPRRYWK